MNIVDKACKLIKKSDYEKFAELLQDPLFNPNELDSKSGKTIIQLSIEAQEEKIFNMLLQAKGIHLETKSKSGETALETAILMNSPDFVESILRSSRKNNFGGSIMCTAIKNKTSSEIIKKLIHHNYDVNENVPEFGSLLNLAIAYDQYENFQTLLDNPNIDIKINNSEDETSLILSTKAKKAEFVQSILRKLGKGENNKLSDIERQFYINSCDKNGDTALHIAAKKDYQTIMDIILREGGPQGLDVEIKNKQGKKYQDIVNERSEALLKEKQNDEYQEKKRIEEKRIKNKEKEEERVRLAKEEELNRINNKKKKKEDQALEAARKEMSIKMEKKRKIWISVISVLVIVGLMYLFFLSAVPNKPKHQEI